LDRIFALIALIAAAILQSVGVNEMRQLLVGDRQKQELGTVITTEARAEWLPSGACWDRSREYYDVAN
jgi:hypothetical protein